VPTIEGGGGQKPKGWTGTTRKWTGPHTTEGEQTAKGEGGRKKKKITETEEPEKMIPLKEAAPMDTQKKTCAKGRKKQRGPRSSNGGYDKTLGPGSRRGGGRKMMREWGCKKSPKSVQHQQKVVG